MLVRMWRKILRGSKLQQSMFFFSKKERKKKKKKLGNCLWFCFSFNVIGWVGMHVFVPLVLDVFDLRNRYPITQVWSKSKLFFIINDTIVCGQMQYGKRHCFFFFFWDKKTYHQSRIRIRKKNLSSHSIALLMMKA